MLLKITGICCLVLAYGVVLTAFASKKNTISKLNRVKRQNPPESPTENEEKAGCQLPPPQQNGQFKPSPRRCLPNNDISYCEMTPGNPVPHNWVLFHYCDPGFILNNTATTASVCLDGSWTPVLPHCVKLCPKLTFPNSEMKCMFRGKEVKCSNEMRPDTLASADCHKFYRSNYQLMCLESGSWTRQNLSSQLLSSDIQEGTPTHCIPECGLSSEVEDTTLNTTSSLTNGVTKQGDYPWVAAIYHKNSDDRWDLTCAGTLINSHIVITAAHCVVLPGDVKLEPGSLRVGLGKYYRNFYRLEPSSLILEVKNVDVIGSYGGTPKFFMNDVALLDLLVEVQVSAHVMPVCVDWGHVYNTPPSGATVELAGWSKTENGSRSEVVTLTHLKLIGNAECYQKLGPRNQRYLTADKSCIEKIEENQSRVGIGGAGVTHEKEGRSFLVGFISTKIPNQQSLLFITNITFEAIDSWIQATTDQLVEHRKLQ